MIENKNQLKKALKEGKIKGIKRIYNFNKNNKIPEGTFGNIETVQTNAYSVKYENLDKACWTWLDGSMGDIEIKDNKIIYYTYISECFDKQKEAEKIQELKDKGIKIEAVEKTDKINKDYGKTRNFYYIARYIEVINEIIEK